MKPQHNQDNEYIRHPQMFVHTSKNPVLLTVSAQSTLHAQIRTTVLIYVIID